MKRVAVGTKNPAKIDAVESKVQIQWPDSEIIPVSVPSGVSEMPMSDAECIQGAKNRASAALAEANADLAFGLEGASLSYPKD